MVVCLDYFVLLGGILLAVAFFTLFERKVMGYGHFRKGPTKVGFFGLLQPFSDALKLFPKDFWKGVGFSFYYYLLAPFLAIFLMCVFWGFYTSFFVVYSFCFGFLVFFCVFSLSVYFLVLSGWGSNSSYSFLGCYRSVAQTVSYEVSMILFLLLFVFMFGCYDLSSFSFYQYGYWGVFCFFHVFVSWLFVCLAEGNRTPFDFSEGESELVSGFNVEYGGWLFSFIFICEYGVLIFLSFLSCLFFLGFDYLFLKCLLLCFFFVWIRISFPRYRYDKLMGSAWLVYLPFSLGALFWGGVF